VSHALPKRHRGVCLFSFSLYVPHTLISCFHVIWFAFYSFVLSKIVLENQILQMDRFGVYFLRNRNLMKSVTVCFLILLLVSIKFLVWDSLQLLPSKISWWKLLS
jgi:hypothetical protein